MASSVMYEVVVEGDHETPGLQPSRHDDGLAPFLDWTGRDYDHLHPAPPPRRSRRRAPRFRTAHASPHEGLLALGDDVVGLAATRPGSTALSASTFLRPWSPQPRIAMRLAVPPREVLRGNRGVAAAVRFPVIQLRIHDGDRAPSRVLAEDVEALDVGRAARQHSPDRRFATCSRHSRAAGAQLTMEL